MNGLLQDLRYSFRMLARTPALTIAAILALAVSIGANAAIFSVVDSVLLKPLPYRDADRLVTVWNSWQEKGFPQLPALPSDFTEWQQQATVFDGLAASRGVDYNLTGRGDAEQVRGARATWNLFPLLGVQPALGRAFTAADGEQGAAPVAVLSHGLWQRRFGSSPEVIGQPLTLDGRAYTVVGVMPSRFNFSLDWKMSGLVTPAIDVWVPLIIAQGEGNDFSLTAVGKLKEGIGIERANADLGTIGERITANVPDHKGIGTTVVALHDLLTRDVRPAVVALTVAVGLVLLIACANVANLLLAKASGRRREIAVRAALGAGHGRLVRQLLTESAVLGACAGTAGLALAFGATALLARHAPPAVLRTGEIGIDLRVLGFTAAVSLLSALIFGLAPALQALRVNLDSVLRESGRGGVESRRQVRARSALVIAEVALAVLLVVGSGLLLQSFLHVISVDPGFRAERLTTARISLPVSRYASSAQRAAFFEEVIGRLRALPEIEAIGVASSAPLEQAREVFYRVEAQSVDGDVKNAPTATNWAVDHTYFRVMGIPLIAGRYLDETDVPGTEVAVVIDESLARRHWPGEDPIGRRVREGYSGDSQPWMRVVGVVGSVRHYGLAAETKPGMYVSHRQSPRPAMTLLARGRSGHAGVAAAIRNVVRNIDADQPVSVVQTMEETIAASVAPRRFSASLLSGFAALALLLAAVGVYALMSYSVSRRTREIGIRKALGAPPRRVVGEVLGQGLALTAGGLAVGCLAGVWLTRLLSTQLYGIKPWDPLTFGGSCLLLLGVAAIACYMPARRANAVDPVIALRQE
jgi:putative ABC transport system permease protein